MIPFFSDAATWDYLWSTQTPQQLLEKLKGTQDASPDWHARVVACLIALDRVDEALGWAEAAIDSLQGRPGIDVELLRAMRLIAIGSARGYQQVIDEAVQPSGSTSRRMEASVHINYMLSISFTNTGRPYQGLMHLGRAQAMAFALDLPHRSRVLTIEGARNAIEWGEHVDVSGLQKAVEASSHQATVRWGRSIVAELMMYGGDYPAALRYARQHGLADLACMLQALNLEFDTPSECLDPHSIHFLTAQGLRAASRQDWAGIPGIPVSHHALTGYGRLLNAQRALNLGDAAAFSSILGQEPKQTDQRAYWYGLRTMAILGGLVQGNASSEMQNLADSLLVMSQPGPVIRVLEALSPQLSLLLARHPDPRVSAIASNVQTPLLMDGHISARVRVPIHRGTCAALISKSVGQRVVINTGFISKARAKATAAGVDWDHLVTAGDLFVLMGQLAMTDPRWTRQTVQLTELVPVLKTVLESGIDIA